MYMYRSTCTTHSPTFLWWGLNLTFLRIIRAGLTGQYLNIHNQIILHNSTLWWGTMHFLPKPMTREACAAEHQGWDNVLNYPSEKIWWSRDHTPTDRLPESLFAPQVYQWKIIQSIGMATELQLKVLFGKKSHGPVHLDFRKKKQRKVVSFLMLFFMFTFMWITKKELERVIENKRGELCRKKTWKFKVAVR